MAMPALGMALLATNHYVLDLVDGERTFSSPKAE